MEETTWDKYCSDKKDIYGFMPLLGPLYLGIRYLDFRFNKDLWSEHKKRREGLVELVRGIQKDFSLAA